MAYCREGCVHTAEGIDPLPFTLPRPGIATNWRWPRVGTRLQKLEKVAILPFSTVFLPLVGIIQYNRDRKSQEDGTNILPLAIEERRTMVNGKYFSKRSEYTVFDENYLFRSFLRMVYARQKKKKRKKKYILH